MIAAPIWETETRHPFRMSDMRQKPSKRLSPTTGAEENELKNTGLIEPGMGAVRTMECGS
jgi:hypothetical protein